MMPYGMIFLETRGVPQMTDVLPIYSRIGMTVDFDLNHPVSITGKMSMEFLMGEPLKKKLMLTGTPSPSTVPPIPRIGSRETLREKNANVFLHKEKHAKRTFIYIYIIYIYMTYYYYYDYYLFIIYTYIYRS